MAAGMIGEDGRLTLSGEKVAECPVEVSVARMVSAFISYIDECFKPGTMLYLSLSYLVPRSINVVKKS